MVAVNGMLSTIAEATALPQDRDGGDAQRVRGGDQVVGDHTDEADRFEGADHHEETDEKQDRGPLDVAQTLVDLGPTHEHGERGTGEGDDGEVEANQVLQEETEHDGRHAVQKRREHRRDDAEVDQMLPGRPPASCALLIAR